MTTLQMAHAVRAVVAPETAPVPRHSVSPKPTMEISFASEARSSKMVAEMRAFGIGLFATVMLARVISILDLDPRPNPTPLVLSNQGVFFFFLFAVTLRLVYVLVPSLPAALRLSSRAGNSLCHQLSHTLRRAETMSGKKIENWLSAAIDATTGDQPES